MLFQPYCILMALSGHTISSGHHHTPVFDLYESAECKILGQRKLTRGLNLGLDQCSYRKRENCSELEPWNIAAK